jgi:hypothetical protein
MQAAEIRRIKFSAEGEPPAQPTLDDFPDLPSVREEAQEVLGYSRKEWEKRGPTIPDAPDSRIANLRRVLAELEIEALDTADVLQYKGEKMAEAVQAYYQSMGSLEGRVPKYQDDEFGWRRRLLAKSDLFVPDHVLQKAVEIKQRLPEVDFWVEDLTKSPDPFLIVGFKDPSLEWWCEDALYLEVWDEPKFEGRG